MKDRGVGLWPYGVHAALLVPFIVWLVAVLAVHSVNKWPDSIPMTPVFLSLVVVGMVPIALMLIEYIASRGGKVDIRGVKLDFGQASNPLPTLEIPGNIGVVGPLVADSTAMNISATLESKTEDKVVCIDLGTGNEWWMSRLFVLCAGAVRIGRPDAIVFVGTEGDVPNRFLSWARPTQLLKTFKSLSTGADPQKAMPNFTTLDKILVPNVPVDITYGDLLEKGRQLSAQLVALLPLFYPPSAYPVAIAARPFAPVVPFPMGEMDGIARYLMHPDYVKRGTAALEQILMDQIGLLRIETTPDKLTIARLWDVFASCLIRSRVDLDDPMDKQLKDFFATSHQFVEFTRRRRHERLAERTEVLQAVVDGLAECGA